MSWSDLQDQIGIGVKKKKTYWDIPRYLQNLLHEYNFQISLQMNISHLMLLMNALNCSN